VVEEAYLQHQVTEVVVEEEEAHHLASACQARGAEAEGHQESGPA